MSPSSIRHTVFAGLVVGIFCLISCGNSLPDDAPDYLDEVRRFKSVIDGDTIQTYSGQLIRLIGVDTPEEDGPYTTAEPGWKGAETFVKSFLNGSNRVYLEFGQERYDDHGRLLAYVYRPGDYRMLNRALLEAGWAEAYRKFSYERKEEFLRLENRARREEKGIWGKQK